MIEYIVVGLGGALGAYTRFRIASLLTENEFPLGTLLVNISGSFLLGLVIFSEQRNIILLGMGTGFCGALTTFSTFSLDTYMLWNENQKLKATVYASLSIVLSVSGLILASLIT